MALGEAGYLTKPIDRERLTELVRRYRVTVRPTRVLVVEDDEMQRQRIRAWLEPQHWEIKEAVNGRTALHLLDAEVPGVILLDLTSFF